MDFENDAALFYEDYKATCSKFADGGPGTAAEAIMCDALERVLRSHPFVKAKVTEHESEQHKFHMTGFSCNVPAFRKYLRSPIGRTLSQQAGGNSDDALYTVSALLRETLPRGLHIVRATHKANGNITTFSFRGIPKFTGLVASDEDEKSNSDASAFFFDGKSLSDVVEVYKTEKSNGENAKLAVRVIDDVLYLLAGSKMTCLIWPASRKFEKEHPREPPLAPGEDEIFPGRTIAAIWEQWFHGLTETVRTKLVDDVFRRCQTIVAEVNRPWAEHLIPIPYLFMECYSIIGLDHRPMPPATVFEIFRGLGLRQDGENDYDKDVVRHVKRERIPLKTPEQLNDIATQCRRQTDTEGVVLYLLGKSDEHTSSNQQLQTIGLVKVKTNTYVYNRRMREKLKSQFFRALMSGQVKGMLSMNKPCTVRDWNSITITKLIERLKSKIATGFAQLTHLPDCEAMSAQWAQCGIGFVADYLVPKWDELFRADSEAAGVPNGETVSLMEHLGSLEQLEQSRKDACSGRKATAADGPLYSSIAKLLARFQSQYATMLEEYQRMSAVEEAPAGGK